MYNGLLFYDHDTFFEIEKITTLVIRKNAGCSYLEMHHKNRMDNSILRKKINSKRKNLFNYLRREIGQ